MVFVEDDDSLGLFEELKNGTDPFEVDTDRDGLQDDTEFFDKKTSPLLADTDSDGIFDGKEVEIGTSPVSRDSDGDKLLDGDELNRYSTSPTNSDTDNDQLNDFREQKQVKTSPTNADADGDGLTDGKELMGIGTDPMKTDTDGDGLTDGIEHNEKETDPFNPDTDEDKLSDSKEFDIGTSPTTSDTDGDGLPDGTEVHGDVRGLNKADPLHKDIFIEVDWMRGTGKHKAELQEMKVAFANAPVKNPDNKTGIRVHLWFDGSVSREDVTTVEGYFNNQHESEFSRKGWGYYHVLIVNNVQTSTGRNMAGGTVSGEDGMIVQHFTEPDATGSTTMHELGHALGLSEKDFEGIDSKRFEDDEYPSVMNYNYPDRGDDPYQFSSGTNGTKDFDDWGHITKDGLPSPELSKILKYAKKQMKVS